MNMNKTRCLLLLLMLSVLNLAAGTDNTNADTGKPYVVLDENLTQLRDDFNAHQGGVRLLFLIGPTCAICLRGMADLNDEFIAAAQNDPRMFTLSVHLPTLGAEEKDVVPSMPLLDGPRIRHYWNKSGILGKHYTEVLGIDFYAWDIWMVYGPEARWDGVLPPEPDFWMHQLGPIKKADRLDAAVFAEETNRFLVEVDLSAPTEPVDDPNLYADGHVIDEVWQSMGFAMGTHIRGRGGYENLKRIDAVTRTGVLEIAGHRFPLKIETTRPNTLRRTVETPQGLSTLTFDGESLATEGPFIGLGIDEAVQRELFASFEFDGPIVEWKDKGHSASQIGMEKVDRTLAFKLNITQKSRADWNLYISSRHGGIVRAELLNDEKEPVLLITQEDFEQSDGFLFAHRVEYREPDGTLLAVESFDVIDVKARPIDLEAETVIH
jgi:hypothetical protein